MKPFIDSAVGSPEFKRKTAAQRKLINEALRILSDLGIPTVGMTPRRLERMALVFLAVADVKASADWPNAKGANEGRSLKTRDIIGYLNEHFREHISSGSYDDIRRQDLRLSVLSGVIVQTKPQAARNDPERGYALSAECANVVRAFGKKSWDGKLEQYRSARTLLSEQLTAERNMLLVPIKLPSAAKELVLSPGRHNELQKAVIEEFLPRFGFGAEVVYLGDSANKALWRNEDRMRALNISVTEHGELPDVIAFSKQKNWLYMIEAVYTSGPVSPTRLMVLKQLTAKSTASVICVTAFPDRQTFRKYVTEIAWETEVWIAEDPDHLIHFNGEKFLYPISSPPVGKRCLS